MKILLINKYHYMVGGAERYYFDLAELLRGHGHEVAFFSMQHKNNLPTPWGKYFVTNIEFKNITFTKGVKIFFRMLYSLEAKQKINQLLDEFQPDLVHVHNIYYHLSPSILLEIKKRNIPIVYTVHDYHLVTPNVTFFHNGAICNISLRSGIFAPVFHACVQNSRLASLATSFCLSLHTMFGVYKKTVDFFISPSIFMKNALINNGYSAEKILLLSNFINTKKRFQQPTRHTKKNYVLFVGDSSEKKGLQVFMEATRRLPFITFYVAGKGTDKYRNRTDVTKKHQYKNIVFLGYVPPEQLQTITAKSAFIVVPSLWYENQPYVILEAFALEKPVVASAIGGIPEIVKHGKNGILFEPNNINACTKAINALWRTHALRRKMGNYARQYGQKTFSPDAHYHKIMEIYKMAQCLHPIKHS